MFDEAVERLAHWHKVWPLGRPRVPDRHVLFGVPRLLPQQHALVGQPVVERRQRAERRHLLPEPVPAVLDVLLDLPLLPAGGDVAELGVKQVVAHHRAEPRVDLADLAGTHPVDGGLHVVVDAAAWNATPRDERVMMRVEQHLMGLQQIGTQEERTAVTELELCHLQLRALAVDDGPVLAPVELERFAGRKPERNKRPAPGRLCLLVLLLSPAPGKRRDTVVGAGEAQRTEVRVNLLKGSALFAGPVRFGLEPACQLRSKPVELAGAVALGVSRQHSVGPYVTPDRVSGHAQPFGNLA